MYRLVFPDGKGIKEITETDNNLGPYMKGDRVFFEGEKAEYIVKEIQRQLRRVGDWGAERIMDIVILEKDK